MYNCFFLIFIIGVGVVVGDEVLFNSDLIDWYGFKIKVFFVGWFIGIK